MPVRNILEKRLRIDRSPALPVEHGQDAPDPGIEIEGAGVSADFAVHRPLDGQGLERHALRPVLPLSSAQAAASGSRGSGPASSPSCVRRAHSIPACIAVPMLAACCLARSTALTPLTASATALRTNSGSRAPGLLSTSSIAASKYRRSSLRTRAQRRLGNDVEHRRDGRPLLTVD